MAMFPNAVAAFAFLVFNLLDSPCLAAISTMSQEMNSKKWTWAIRLRIYWWTSFLVIDFYSSSSFSGFCLSFITSG